MHAILSLRRDISDISNFEPRPIAKQHDLFIYYLLFESDHVDPYKNITERKTTQ